MSKQANPTFIGAFVLGGVALAIGAILVFSSGSLYQERPLFIMYFDGSVNGLNVGSPVNVLGVQVGTVKSIALVNDPSKGEVRIPVVAEFHPEAITSIGQQGKNRKENMQKMVEEFGLRAQLRQQNILTGQLLVQLDYYPGTEYKYYGHGKLIEVPVISSTLEQLEKKLEESDFSVVVDNISSAAAAIAQLAVTPELKQAIKSLNKTLVATSDLVADINRQVGPLAKSANNAFDHLDKTLIATNTLVKDVNTKLSPLENNLNVILGELHGTLTKVDKAAINIKQFSNEDSATIYKLNTALDELAYAAKSIRALADTLERHPEALIQGKK